MNQMSALIAASLVLCVVPLDGASVQRRSTGVAASTPNHQLNATSANVT